MDCYLDCLNIFSNKDYEHHKFRISYSEYYSQKYILNKYKFSIYPLNIHGKGLLFNLQFF